MILHALKTNLCALNFIYFGAASFSQERMKYFLKIGKDLQIKEIKEVPEKEEMVDIGDNEKPHHNVISEEISSDDNDYIDENNIGSSTSSNECSQQISVPSQSQCPECNDVFSNRNHMLRHVTYTHQHVKYPCNLCDHKATTLNNLKRHIGSVHVGVKYPCSQCVYKATTLSNLKRHTVSLSLSMREQAGSGCVLTINFYSSSQ